MRTSQLIKADTTILDVKPNNGTDYQLDELQKFVGGLIEIANLADGRIMVMNEEGAINGLPVNAVASACFSLGRGRLYPIHGDVLVCDSDMVQ